MNPKVLTSNKSLIQLSITSSRLRESSYQRTNSKLKVLDDRMYKERPWCSTYHARLLSFDTFQINVPYSLGLSVIIETVCGVEAKLR